MGCPGADGNGELLAAATALAILLAQGQGSAQRNRLAAFFTIVGDALALLALEPPEYGEDQG